MFLPPMLLEKREEPFDDDRYIFEPKIDGHRMIISVHDGKVRLFTRNQLDVTRQYPELHSVSIDDVSDVVMDGEVACINPGTGSIEFELIQERFMKRKPMSIMQAQVKHPVTFFAFDILRYKGNDLRGRPLMERKTILSQVLRDSAHFSHVINIESKGTSMFEVIREKRMEGMVAKRTGSRYVGRRDPAWVKIINYQYADVFIAGYRKHQFGWLLRFQNKPVGILELAVPAAHRKAFHNLSKSIITGEDRNFVYVQPVINARIRFRNWTRSGMLRTPEFVEFVV